MKIPSVVTELDKIPEQRSLKEQANQDLEEWKHNYDIIVHGEPSNVILVMLIALSATCHQELLSSAERTTFMRLIESARARWRGLHTDTPQTSLFTNTILQGAAEPPF